MKTSSPTQADITAVAERFQREVGPAFTVHPNGYGIHVRCNTCGQSACHDIGYLFGRNHKHEQ